MATPSAEGSVAMIPSESDSTALQSSTGPLAQSPAPAGVPSTTTVDDGKKETPPKPEGPPIVMMKYTSMTGVSGAIQTKNMSSSFMKEDKQSWWYPPTNRRNPNTQQVMQNLRQKKRKLMVEDTNEQAVDGKSKTGEADKEDESALQTSRAGTPDSLSSSTRDVKGKSKQSDKTSVLPDPEKVIIVHPGSRTLRIGRASDGAPFEIPNVIARKLKAPAKATNPSDLDPSRNNDLSEDSLEILKLDLRARMRIMKLRGTSGGSTAAKEYNETVQGQEIPDEEDDYPITWLDPSSSNSLPQDVVFGDDALRIDNAVQHNWSLRYPFKNGTFNTESYQSTQELLGDIIAIWRNALETKCEVDLKKLDQYSVILLIPDLYEHVYVREMCELLLVTMGFAQIILQQEGLSATFAAGLPSACVVDMGASKISISCIDEGMVINDSRMSMNFGGDDIAQTFLQVVKTIDFPYKDVDLTKTYDWDLMQWLMEQCCAFNEHNYGVNTFEFFARRPNRKTVKYTMKLHDEVILPTLSFWNPRILDWDRKLIEKPKLWKTPRYDEMDIDEVIDIGGDAVTLAMKKATAHLEQARAGANATLTVPGAPQPLVDGTNAVEGLINSVASPAIGEDGASPAPPTPMVDAKPTFPDPSAPSGSPAPSTTGVLNKLADKTQQADTATVPHNGPTIDHFFESSKLPLDIAVLESLAHTGSDEKLKRVVTNILIVGGVGNMQGVGFALQSRLEPLIRARFPGAPAPLVIPTSKYSDAAHVSWAGIQNLCKLELINELWIRTDDWDL